MAVKRECSKCSKDLGERHGKYRYCLECHAANMRTTRPKYSELSPITRMKANARAYAHVYLNRGKIKKGPCKKCGNKQSQMHHEDYSKPLEVTWLCRPHHLEHHA